jgi:serine/threonine protein kinase
VSNPAVPERLSDALADRSYMAPEQATADLNVDQRADIYAIGIVAYKLLLAGQPQRTKSGSSSRLRIVRATFMWLRS